MPSTKSFRAKNDAIKSLAFQSAVFEMLEIRWVLKDVAGIELPPPSRKTIDLEGRIVKDGVGKTVKDRKLALNELVKAIREFRKFTGQPLTLRGFEYAHAVQELNRAIDRADRLLR